MTCVSWNWAVVAILVHIIVPVVLCLPIRERCRTGASNLAPLESFLECSLAMVTLCIPILAAARAHGAALQRAILLAAELEIETVVTFSGVAGAQEASGRSQLNWPVLSSPYEQSDYWHRVWNEQLIPYWQPMAAFAERRGVRIALELHGGFLPVTCQGLC